MSWDVLREEAMKSAQKREALNKVVSIVQKHPEWQRQEPELKKLLEVFVKAS